MTGENYQDAAEVKTLYNSDFCVTLDELPKDLFKSSSPQTTTTEKKETTTAASTTTTVSAQNGSAALIGDVNEDVLVDVSDAVLLARLIAEDTEASVTEQGLLNADMNGNGQPDSDDVIMILKKIAKMI